MSANIESEESSHHPCCSMSDGNTRCPMASQFEATFGSGKFTNRLRSVGLILVLLGVVIVVWPVVAVWLTATVFVILGIMVLMASSMLKRMGSNGSE